MQQALPLQRGEGKDSIQTVNSIAQAQNSNALGYNTIAKVSESFIVGKNNNENSTALFAVGNGENESQQNRSNAFEVYEDGNVVIPNGDLRVNGNLIVSGESIGSSLENVVTP